MGVEPFVISGFFNDDPTVFVLPVDELVPLFDLQLLPNVLDQGYLLSHRQLRGSNNLHSFNPSNFFDRKMLKGLVLDMLNDLKELKRLG